MGLDEEQPIERSPDSHDRPALSHESLEPPANNAVPELGLDRAADEPLRPTQAVAEGAEKITSLTFAAIQKGQSYRVTTESGSEYTFTRYGGPVQVRTTSISVPFETAEAMEQKECTIAVGKGLTFWASWETPNTSADSFDRRQYQQIVLAGFVTAIDKIG